MTNKVMNPKINLAIQVLPSAKDKHPYTLVDEAIQIIKESGLKYMVCPFETVIEGDFETLMDLVKKIHEACYSAGTESMIANIKIQSSSLSEVKISDKMEKYLD